MLPLRQHIQELRYENGDKYLKLQSHERLTTGDANFDDGIFFPVAVNKDTITCGYSGYANNSFVGDIYVFRFEVLEVPQQTTVIPLSLRILDAFKFPFNADSDIAFSSDVTCGNITYSAPERVRGDADGDGILTFSDLMRSLDHIEGNEVITDYFVLENIDMDGDKVITFTDLMLLLMIIEGVVKK